MAQHLSAERQARKALRRRARNRTYMSKMKTIVRKVRESKEKEKAVAEFKKATKLLDQLVAKGIIHRNSAANKKSTLNKYINSL